MLRFSSLSNKFLLCLQEKCGASAIVDTATLTGACMIALGGEIAGLFSPTDAAAADVVAAAKAAGECNHQSISISACSLLLTLQPPRQSKHRCDVNSPFSLLSCSGEKMWRMPMEDNYFDQLKSPIADMKNTGTRSVTGEVFYTKHTRT